MLLDCFFISFFYDVTSKEQQLQSNG